ncbi:MAG: YggT family protein [Acidimicrobiales bacterium]
MAVLCLLIQLAILVFFLRAVLSWFPLEPGGVMAKVNGALFSVTEPVLAPLRRAIPPAGRLDMSFLVLIIGLFLLSNIIC